MLILLLLSQIFAYDCQNSPGFQPINHTNVFVQVAQPNEDDDGDVCKVNVNVPIYDVSGREEEAYYCLKPQAAHVVKCENSEYRFEVVPAFWYRTTNNLKEARFHAYVISKTKPSDVQDIYSRIWLVQNPGGEFLLEGAHRDMNTKTGFYIRMMGRVP